MQRYRLNTRLLTTLVVGFLVAAPALFFLWRFQVNRNAVRLLEDAKVSEEKGDFNEAFESLSQYVKLRVDDVNGHLRLGHAAVALSERDDINMETRSKAYFAVVEAVLRASADDAEWPGTEAEQKAMKDDLIQLRRDLVKLHMQYGFLDRSLQVIDELIKDGHEDGELDALKAQCLFASQDMGKFTQWAYEVIGYNQQTKEFDLKPRAADQPIVYGLLARYLLNIDEDALAERVTDKMVEANPKSLDAFTIQYQLLKLMDDKDDEAREALAKAFALDPTDAGVLQAKGSEAIADYDKAMKESTAEGADGEKLKKEADEHLDAAAKFFAQGIEEYPDRIDFYVQASRIETFRKKTKEALAIVDKGLEKFPLDKRNAVGMPLAIELVNQKIDILFQQKDTAAVQKEIEKLRELKNERVDPLAEYYEARIELDKENYLEAARRFNDVKTRLIGSIGLQALASTYQAICHQQLNQLDLALESANWALDKNPDLTMAQALAQDIRNRVGLQSPDEPVMQFDEEMRRRALLPAAQQNWDQFAGEIESWVRAQAEKMGRDEKWIKCRVELLTAQMYVTRASVLTDKEAQKPLFLQARDAVRRAYNLDRDDISIQLAMPRILMLEPDGGPGKALEMLDVIIANNKKRGVEETLPFRLLRIDLLFAQRDEQLIAKLRSATEGIEKWSPSQQAEVWAAVGNRFEQLQELAEAELCFKEAARLAPSLLQYRTALFELARQQANDEAMRDAQKGILEVVGSEAEPDYVLTEVKRLMINHATGAISADELKRARTLLDEAIRRRPGWAELYILSGQLALVLEKDPALALKNLNLALEHGPTNINALNLQIRLLADQRQFDAARKIMDRIPEANWTGILDRTAANVLRNIGEADQAFVEAKKLADANPKDPPTQLWFAEVAMQAEEFAAAEAAYKAAIAADVSNPDMWSALLNYYMIRKQGDQVESTLRESQLALDEEYSTLLTAQQHRLFGRFSQAESIFLSSYGDRLEELPVAQRLAEFYLGWGELDPTYRGKAAPYINRILRAANEGKAPKTDPTVAWARRQAARLFSLSGDYQDSLKAEQLLTEAMAENVATPEGQDMLVDILNRRGDPGSRLRAIDLLKQIQKERGLQPNYELLLGEALNGVGKRSEAERQMREAITRHPKDVALRVGLIEMLINRKEVNAAESALARLADVEGGQAAIAQLRIRLAAAQGDMAGVRQQLEALTPNLLRLNEQQLQIVYSLALLAESVGDYEYALRLMTEFARRVPGHELELARYTALYGDLDAGLTMLRTLFPTNMDEVLIVAVEVLRARRAEAPEKLDEVVNLLVRQARRDDEEAARRMVLEAESFEVQQRFDEAITAYGAILARDDVPPFVRASALNNLSFLLAMKKQDLDQGLASVNEAMGILGPISDILDTRALVYFHRGEPDKAVADLKLAVMVGATASKYFHLAEALLATGDRAGAVEAWKEAQARGISVEKTPIVEQPDLKTFMEKISALAAAPST